jgi:predicted NBD/HSP70 family sugar kinase
LTTLLFGIYNRREIEQHFMSNPTGSQQFSAGVSVSANEIRLVISDTTGTVHSQRNAQLELERPISGQIHELLIENDGPFGSLGVAFPGLIDSSTKKIVGSRIPALTGIDIVADLSALVDGRIVIENDANAAAFAEHRLGAGKDSADLFFVLIGEGVGGGLILDRQIWRGASGFAGEIGSIVVDEEGTRLEDVASIPNIVRRTKSRFHQDSTSILNKHPENEISFADILAAAAKDDDLSQMMLERTGIYVGSAIGSVLNVLNIQTVVIGGEITKADSIILGPISQRAKECTSLRAFEDTRIVVSELDENCAAVGVAMLASSLP